MHFLYFAVKNDVSLPVKNLAFLQYTKVSLCCKIKVKKKIHFSAYFEQDVPYQV